MKRNLRWVTVGAVGAAAAMALTACGSNPNESDNSGDGGEGGGQEETVEDPETLILGLVPSQEMDELVEDADELGALISEEIGVPVETFVSESYAALVTAMGTGQAHIGMFGPIALVQAADQSGAEVILQSVRHGSPTYHTQWFTNDPDTYCLDEVVEVTNDDDSVYTFCNGTDSAEAGPAGEDALALIEQDTPISMVDASSASGYYYPATQLQRVADLDPLNLNTQFAGGHPNSILNVANSDYPVGVSFDDARDNVVGENAQIGEEVTVFAYSNEIPNDGVAVAGDLSDELTQQISDAMIAVMETEEGAQMYDEVYSIEGLVPADLDALEEAREVEANFAGL